MHLRRKLGLIIAVFFAGGAIIGYLSVTKSPGIAAALPGWLVIIALAQMWFVRCPRCGMPAVLGAYRIFGRRVWVWLPYINEKCSSCGKALH